MEIRMTPRQLHAVALACALGLALPAMAAKKKVKEEAPAPAAPVTVADADEAQVEASKMVMVGQYNCEFQQTLQVSPNAQYPAYVDVQFGKRTYLMKPILSGTGALRMEDVRGDALLLQIAHKSMLMDTRKGNRLVDGCMSPQQVAAKAEYDAKGKHDSLGIFDSQPATAAAIPVK